MAIWAYAEHCSRVWGRYWAFLFTQAAFMSIEDAYAGGAPWYMREKIAVTACACVLISLWSVAVERIKRMCCCAIYLHQYDAVVAREERGTCLFMQSLGCGMLLFVFAYSVHGMAWIPQISLGASLVCGCFCTRGDDRPPVGTRHMRDDDDSSDDASDTTMLSSGAMDSPRHARRGECKGAFTGMLLSVALLVMYSATTNASTQPMWSAYGVWLGIVLPFFGGAAACRGASAATRGGVRSSRAMAFAMPSLGVISLTVLSFYADGYRGADRSPERRPEAWIPGNDSVAWDDWAPPLPPSNGSDLASFVFHQGLALLNFTGGGFNTTLSDAWLREEAAVWEGLMWQYVSNQTVPYRVYLTVPAERVLNLSGIDPPPSARGGVACIAAPLLLWCALTIFSDALFGGTGRSAVIVWLLASATCAAWWRGIALPLVAAVVLLNLVLLFHVLPDEMSQTLIVSKRAENDGEEGGEEQEIQLSTDAAASRMRTAPDSDA